MQKMIIQTFTVWMLGEPCVKDSKMDRWILHGDICCVAHPRNKNLVLYTAILHIQNSFWFSKSWDFTWHIPLAHIRKLEKNEYLTPPPLFVRWGTFLVPSMHIYVIYLDKWNLGLKKGRLLCVRFDTIMYSLQYGCHLFEYTWENV
jgi:hypothetical protein